MSKRSMTALALAALAAALFPAARSIAATIGTDFESFALGSPHLQDGWSSTGSAGSGCAAYDHAIVDASGYPHLGGAFGTRALRISNAVVSGCFSDQTFSKSLPDEVGETDAVSGGMSSGSRIDRFQTSWDFASADPAAHQPNLQMGISADRGDGARMTLIRMKDLPGGIALEFVHYDRNGGPCASGTFVTTPIAGGLSRTAIHNLRFEVTTVEGTENDVVQIWVDGSLVHSGRGTWEDFFRDCQPPGSRTMDSVLFRTGGTTGIDDAPASAGKGFLIDNVGEASIDPPAPPTIITPLDGASVSSSFTVSGNGPANKGLRLQNGTTTIATTTISGAGQWSVNLSGQTGVLALRAFATDGSIDSAPSNLVMVSTMPNAPVILSPFEGQVVPTNAVTISGTAGPGLRVDVRRTSPGPVLLLGSDIADGSGAWDVPTSLPVGAYTVQAIVADANNIGSFPALRSFRIQTDVTPPSVPTIGTPTNDSLHPALVAIAGGGQSGSLVTVKEGTSTIGQAVTQANGTWSMQVVMRSGAHTITASASDDAGNVSDASNSVDFTVDADAPTVSSTTGNLTPFVGTPEIRGSAGDNRGVARVEIQAFDVLGTQVYQGDATLVLPGASLTLWEAHPTVGPTGVISTIRATAYDAVGNRSAAGSIRIIAIGG